MFGLHNCRLGLKYPTTTFMHERTWSMPKCNLSKFDRCVAAFLCPVCASCFGSWGLDVLSARAESRSAQAPTFKVVGAIIVRVSSLVTSDERTGITLNKLYHTFYSTNLDAGRGEISYRSSLSCTRYNSLL